MTKHYLRANMASQQARGLVSWVLPFNQVSRGAAPDAADNTLYGRAQQYAPMGPGMDGQYGRMLSTMNSPLGRMQLFVGGSGGDEGFIEFGDGEDAYNPTYMTTSAWIIATDNGEARYVIHAKDTGFSGVPWNTYVEDNANDPYIRAAVGGWNASSGSAATTGITYGELTHVAVRYNSPAGTAGSVETFINGRLALTDATRTRTSATSGRDYRISSAAPVSSSYVTQRLFDGGIADCRIYNRMLSDGEIYQLYSPATRFELYQGAVLPFPKLTIGAPPVGGTGIRNPMGGPVVLRNPMGRM